MNALYNKQIINDNNLNNKKITFINKCLNDIFILG